MKNPRGPESTMALLAGFCVCRIDYSIYIYTYTHTHAPAQERSGLAATHGIVVSLGLAVDPAVTLDILKLSTS